LQKKKCLEEVPEDMPATLPPRSKEVDLDDFEDLLPEEVQQFREEMQEKKRAAVALTAEDTQKVCKMH